MVIVSKYKKYTHKFQRYKVLFLGLFLCLYVTKASNVTSISVPAKTTSYNFDRNGIKCYSIVCNNENTIFISSNFGLFIYNGFHWITVPLYEKFLLVSANDNLIYIAGNKYIGKLIYELDNKPVIEKLILNDRGQEWSDPDSFYIQDNHFVISSGKAQYKIETKNIVKSSPLKELPKNDKFIMEPGHSINIESKGKLWLTDSQQKKTILVKTDFNEADVPVIAYVQDQNRSIWELFPNAVKRIDVFDYATFYNDSVPKTLFSKALAEKTDESPDINLRLKGIQKELSNRQLFSDTIVTDSQRNIWVKCRKLIKAAPELFIIPSLPDNEIRFLHVYYKDLGLSSITKIQISGDSIVSLYGKEGMICFNTVKFLNEPRIFPLNVNNLSSGDGKVIYQQYFGSKIKDTHISVNATVETITFCFEAPDLRGNNEVLYSTYLEGHDSKWSEWQEKNSQTFGYLTGGIYRFHVKAMSNNGRISPETSMVFTIQTPIFYRWGAWSLYVIFLASLILIYWYRRKKGFEREKEKLESILSERTAELMREKAKTDELLANLLPKDTADELKNTGKATSQKYNMVTVLFSDIQGFTKIAEEMNPDKLIDELDNFFFHFDSVVEKYNIEKIKTIGDAYMCAGGIPYKNRTNPVEVVLAALEMQDYMKQLRQKNVNIWDLRIGVHTGAVIAGVVGHKRVSYDIWGDTVNTASRMESSGEAGKVNISGQTFEMIKDFFICEYRGKMPVKYKGDIDMFFVKAIRPELSVDLKVVPNKSFFIQLQLLRLQDLEEFILQKLTEDLPGTIIFHNSRQTKDVYSVVELIGRAENLSPEEMLVVRTAALFLNIGYCGNYKDHVMNSTRAAGDLLPKFKYSSEQIHNISELIRSTSTRFNHSGKLESILADACNNYIGRVDYLMLAIDLFNEVKHHNGGISEKEWFSQQAYFLEHFNFYTVTANLLREVSASEQILKIKEYAKID